MAERLGIVLYRICILSAILWLIFLHFILQGEFTKESWYITEKIFYALLLTPALGLWLLGKLLRYILSGH